MVIRRRARAVTGLGGGTWLQPLAASCISQPARKLRRCTRSTLTTRTPVFLQLGRLLLRLLGFGAGPAHSKDFASL